MIANEQVDALRGTTAYDRDGSEIGTIEQVYFDDESGAAEWITVRTGLFGTSESFVPLAEADLRGDGLVVAASKHTVKDAPRVDAGGGHISADEEAELYRYYGLSPTGTETGTGYRAERGGEAMTRSEEQLRVGTERGEVGRARLRKHVVTENVEQPVQVRREEVRLEREPITDDNRGAARSGPDITEDEYEVTLHEERPVVDKEVRPVERVRLGTETVHEQETVRGEVRKEQIEADVPDDRTR